MNRINFNEFIRDNLLFGNALIDLSIFTKEGSNQIWTGFVATNHGELPAYIKKCRFSDGIAIELITALLGIYLDLPIPRPIVVRIEPGHPQIPVSQTSYLFGSEMYQMPSFERFIRDNAISEECLMDYEGLPQILSFDELVANCDRHRGNILYDGENYRFIDHEGCFSTKQNPRSPLHDMLKLNTIADIVQHYKGENDIYIHKLMMKIKEVVKSNFITTDLDALLMAIKVNPSAKNYNSHIDRIRNFTSARMEQLVLLVENAIKPPNNDAQIDWIEGLNNA